MPTVPPARRADDLDGLRLYFITRADFPGKFVVRGCVIHGMLPEFDAVAPTFDGIAAARRAIPADAELVDSSPINYPDIEEVWL